MPYFHNQNVSYFQARSARWLSVTESPALYLDQKRGYFGIILHRFCYLFFQYSRYVKLDQLRFCHSSKVRCECIGQVHNFLRRILTCLTAPAFLACTGELSGTGSITRCGSGSMTWFCVARIHHITTVFTFPTEITLECRTVACRIRDHCTAAVVPKQVISTVLTKVGIPDILK